MNWLLSRSSITSSNAVKYGAGEPIEVSLFRNGTAARSTVRDHGIGTGAERPLSVQSGDPSRGRGATGETRRYRPFARIFRLPLLVAATVRTPRDPAGAPVPICQQGEVLDSRSLRACRAILGESL